MFENKLFVLIAKAFYTSISIGINIHQQIHRRALFADISAADATIGADAVFYDMLPQVSQLSRVIS